MAATDLLQPLHLDLEADRTGWSRPEETDDDQREQQHGKREFAAKIIAVGDAPGTIYTCRVKMTDWCLHGWELLQVVMILGNW